MMSKKSTVIRPKKELDLLDGISQTSAHLLLLERLLVERERITQCDSELNSELFYLIANELNENVKFLKSLDK